MRDNPFRADNSQTVWAEWHPDDYPPRFAALHPLASLQALVEPDLAPLARLTGNPAAGPLLPFLDAMGCPYRLKELRHWEPGCPVEIELKPVDYSQWNDAEHAIYSWAGRCRASPWQWLSEKPRRPKVWIQNFRTSGRCVVQFGIALTRAARLLRGPRGTRRAA